MENTEMPTCDEWQEMHDNHTINSAITILVRREIDYGNGVIDSFISTLINALNAQAKGEK